MDSTLEDIEFLARSPNRIAVLDALCAGARERSTLLESIGMSRVTLGRCLAELEERGWIERDGHEYALTPLGELVIRAFGMLRETVATTRKLDAVIEWLPTAHLGFDLTRLADAEITVPTSADPYMLIRRSAVRLGEADDVRVVSHAMAAETLEANWRATTEGTQTFEAVFESDAIAVAAKDPGMRAHLRELLECERAAIYVYEGGIPYVMVITDDVVMFGLSDDEGTPRAIVETDDDTVYSWAEATIEDYREASRSLAREDLDGDPR